MVAGHQTDTQNLNILTGYIYIYNGPDTPCKGDS